MTPKLAFDTNAYRALDDGNAQLAHLVRSAEQLGLPIIVLGELYHGVFLGHKQEQNLTKLSHFLSSPRLEVLRIDETTCKFFGEIAAILRKTGKPIRQNDMWIAALCKQYGYTLATADKDFERVVGLETVRF